MPGTAIRALSNAIPLAAAERLAWGQRFARVPGLAHLGVEVDLSDDVLVSVRLPHLEEHHLGGVGTRAVNGAVLASLFDCALGVAGALQFPQKRVGTCELSMQFQRPVFASPVEALAGCTRRTSNLAFVASEIWSDGKRCAVATGIVALSSNEEPAFW
jgi:uncharacterized protein (TIGR00369 family)